MKIRTAQELMKENMLVKHYAGSISYGTNLPTSDVDFRGIFCADPVNVRTPFFTVKECEDVDEEDTKLFELSHFMKLCLDCNPNVIETLWVDDSDITFRTPAYDMLRDHRHELLSSKIAFTTSGYAMSQLKRIKGHNKWINNPQPVEAPKPKDYVSMIRYFGNNKMLKFDIDAWNDNHRLFPYGGDVYGVYAEPNRQIFDRTGKLNTCYDGDGSQYEDSPPVMIVKFNKEVYKEFKTKHEMFWQWKNNRNETRGELEEAHGYDTKHAMHLVRLLRMGAEVLRDEEVIVKRPDAEELLAIRGGDWTYEEILKYSESLDKEIRDVLYKKTKLRKTPDIKFAAQLLMDTQDLVWSKTK